MTTQIATARELTPALITTILESAPIGMMLLDRNGNVVWHNGTMNEYLGMAAATSYPQDTPITEKYGWLFEPEDMIYVMQEGDRPARWLKNWQRPLDDGHVLYCFIDVTEQQQLHSERNRLAQQLSELTTRDSLTGLPNLRGLMQHLEPLVSRCRRYGNPLSIIQLNADDPARLDEEYGAATGQTVMAAVSHTLKDQLRWTDIIGRLDAGKFLLILPETASDAALELVNKIAAPLAALTLKNAADKPVRLTLRYAVTGWEKGDDARKLLDRAAQLADSAGSQPGCIAVG